MKLHLIIPKAHVKVEHVKHAAGIFTIGGTAMELLHIIPYAGAILLGAGAMIAIYEPYFVHEVKEVFLETDA